MNDAAVAAVLIVAACTVVLLTAMLVVSVVREIRGLKDDGHDNWRGDK